LAKQGEEIEKVAVAGYGGSALFARVMPSLKRKRLMEKGSKKAKQNTHAPA